MRTPVVSRESLDAQPAGPHKQTAIDAEINEGHTVGCGLRWGLSGGVLLSHTVPGAVPSALVGLASGFGMGPGVSPPLWPP